ncbi:24077_t:CDS:1, partial [Dentiscutata erythropus]
KLNKGHFPTLLVMARDFLAILSTSVVSEQMLATQDMLSTILSLDPDTITALI